MCTVLDSYQISTLDPEECETREGQISFRSYLAPKAQISTKQVTRGDISRIYTDF